MYKWKA